MAPNTNQLTAAERRQLAPEIVTSSEAIARSNFRLDPAITAGVLGRFARASLNSSNTPDLSQHVIIGITGTTPDQAATTKVGDKLYHTLPVIPVDTDDPDLIDWSEPIQRITQTGFNYRAVGLLFNIATYGTVSPPEAPDDTVQTDTKSHYDQFPDWLKHNMFFAACYAGSTAVSGLLRRREAKKVARKANWQKHRQTRFIAETAAYSHVIRKYTD